MQTLAADTLFTKDGMKPGIDDFKPLKDICGGHTIYRNGTKVQKGQN